MSEGKEVSRKRLPHRRTLTKHAFADGECGGEGHRPWVQDATLLCQLLDSVGVATPPDLIECHAEDWLS